MFLLVLCVLPLGTGSLLHWSYHKTSSPNHPPCAYGSLLLMLADLSRHTQPHYVCASHSCNLWYAFLSLPHCKHLSSLTQSMSCCFVCVQAPDYPCKRHVCDSGVLAPPLSVLAPILRVISIFACYSAHVSRISFLTKSSSFSSHHQKASLFQVHASAVWRHDNVTSWPRHTKTFKLQLDRASCSSAVLPTDLLPKPLHEFTKLSPVLHEPSQIAWCRALKYAFLKFLMFPVASIIWFIFSFLPSLFLHFQFCDSSIVSQVCCTVRHHQAFFL